MILNSSLHCFSSLRKMNVIRGNFHKYPSLRQVVTALSHCPLHRHISLSVARHDSAENEEPAFGLLASDPSSKFYERKGQEKLFPKNSVLDEEVQQKSFKGGGKAYGRRPILRHDRGQKSSHQVKSEEQQVSIPASRLHKAFQDKQALEKWQIFKNARDEKIEMLSQNLRADDDEEEDIQRFSSKLDRVKDFTEKFEKRKRMGKKTGVNLDYSLGAQLSLKEKEEEPFGQLSPQKDLYEDESGDEGDELQRKYEEAKLERRHTTAYYGFQMKKLCNERKVRWQVIFFFFFYV